MTKSVELIPWCEDTTLTLKENIVIHDGRLAMRVAVNVVALGEIERQHFRRLWFRVWWWIKARWHGVKWPNEKAQVRPPRLRKTKPPRANWHGSKASPAAIWFDIVFITQNS